MERKCSLLALLLSLLAAAAANELVYVLTLRGRDFGEDGSIVSVRVNSVPVQHVLLHNSTAVSFVIPRTFVDDAQVRDSSSVEVEVGGQGIVRAVPMKILADVVKEVAMEQFVMGVWEGVKGDSGDVLGGRNIRVDEEGRKDTEVIKTSNTDGGKMEAEEEGAETGKEKTSEMDELWAEESARKVHEFTTLSEEGALELGRRMSDEEVGGAEAMSKAFQGGSEEKIRGAVERLKKKFEGESEKIFREIWAKHSMKIINKVDNMRVGQPRKPFMDAAEEEAEEIAAAKGLESMQEAPSLTAEEREVLERYDEAVDLLGRTGQRKFAQKTRSILEKNIAMQHAPSMSLLGRLGLTGDTPGFERDFEEAIPLLRSSSDLGDPDGQAMMGLLYASGMAEPDVMKDVGRAVLLWTVAAEGGSNYAKMALAFRLHTGLDVPENCERAAKLYRQVARDVVLESRRSSRVTGTDGEERDGLTQIRPSTPRADQAGDRKRLFENMEFRARGESNEIIQYYKHAADRGDTAAQVMIGNLYYYGGANMPRNPARARRLFERAATAGRNDAHAHLGFMDLHEGRNASAIRHLEKAAAANNKLGFHGMGYVTLHGIGVEKNAELAADYFTKAAEAEHPEAMYNLGLMYTNGIGVERSIAQAYRYFQEAARFGHLQANYNIGVQRLEGMAPSPPDCNGAISKNLKDIAQQGLWNMALSRALRSFENGNYGNALFRYMQAAHAGIELAQYNSAFMLEHNLVFNSNAAVVSGSGSGMSLLHAIGIEVDDGGVKIGEENGAKKRRGGGKDWTRAASVAEALDMYYMSSSQGYSPSMVRLGDLAYGEGNDMRRATYAYERAFRMRNAEGAFNLGWMHAVGLVSRPDTNLAKRYFDDAKSMDPKAIIPASIALYALQYHETLLKVWDGWRSFKDGTISLLDTGERNVALDVDPSSESSSNFSHEMLLVSRYGDIGLVLVLVGILAWIVNARQRRLVQEDVDDGEDAVMGAVGIEGLGNNRADVHERQD